MASPPTPPSPLPDPSLLRPSTLTSVTCPLFFNPRIPPFVRRPHHVLCAPHRRPCPRVSRRRPASRAKSEIRADAYPRVPSRRLPCRCRRTRPIDYRTPLLHLADCISRLLDASLRLCCSTHLHLLITHLLCSALLCSLSATLSSHPSRTARSAARTLTTAARAPLLAAPRVAMVSSTTSPALRLRRVLEPLFCELAPLWSVWC